MEAWRLVCPLCDERGNFALAHHEEKKAKLRKALDFETYLQPISIVLDSRGAAVAGKTNQVLDEYRHHFLVTTNFEIVQFRERDAAVPNAHAI